MSAAPAATFVWDGGTDPCLDRPVVDVVGPVAIGRFGGSTRHGATKNEDAALVWVGSNWVVAAVLDAHGGIASATATLAIVAEHRADVERLLDDDDPGALVRLQKILIEVLTAVDTTAHMSAVKGETACLIVCAKGSHLLWISVGDNMLYLSHPELAALGQYSLTVRNFYEWIGERSSVGGPIPCFSTGIRALRQGASIVALATDGLLEMGDRRYEHPATMHQSLTRGAAPREAIASMLNEAAQTGARDSCTIIAWLVDNPWPGLMPSG